jgi:hypothetical protein
MFKSSTMGFISPYLVDKINASNLCIENIEMAENSDEHMVCLVFKYHEGNSKSCVAAGCDALRKDNAQVERVLKRAEFQSTVEAAPLQLNVTMASDTTAADPDCVRSVWKVLRIATHLCLSYYMRRVVTKMSCLAHHLLPKGFFHLQ